MDHGYSFAMSSFKQPRQSLDEAQAAIQARVAEIDDALSAMDPLQEERERLKEALRLIGAHEQPAAGRSKKSRQSRASPASPKPRTRSARYKNRDAVLTYLREHPNAQAGEIVAALQISRGVAYNLLGRLVEQRLIVRHTGDNNRARYAAADPPTL